MKLIKRRTEKERLCIELMVATSNIARQCRKIEKELEKMHELSPHLTTDELKVQKRYLTMLISNVVPYTHLFFKRSVL